MSERVNGPQKGWFLYQKKFLAPYERIRLWFVQRVLLIRFYASFTEEVDGSSVKLEGERRGIDGNVCSIFFALFLSSCKFLAGNTARIRLISSRHC